MSEIQNQGRQELYQALGNALGRRVTQLSEANSSTGRSDNADQYDLSRVGVSEERFRKILLRAAARSTNPKSPASSRPPVTRDELRQELGALLPRDMEIVDLRLFQTRKPNLERSEPGRSVRFAVVKVRTESDQPNLLPPDLVRELEATYKTSLVFKPQQVTSGIKRKLCDLSDQHGIISSPRIIDRMIENFQGEEPDLRLAKSPLRSRLLDLTRLSLVTVDPSEAREKDDAIGAERINQNTIRTYTAYADATAALARDDELERLAIKRGFSYYGAAVHIPMLGSRLGRELSLEKGDERIAWVAIADIAEGGSSKLRGFVRARIKVHESYSYEQATEALASRAADPVLALSRMASAQLRGWRERSSRFVEMDEGQNSHQIVSEYMIAANSQLAQLFRSEGYQIINRVHSGPREYIPTWIENLRKSGIEARAGDFSDQRRFAALIEALQEIKANGPLHEILKVCALGAQYSCHNVGHYSLGLEHYAHWKALRGVPGLFNQRVAEARELGIEPPTSQKLSHVAKQANRKDELYYDSVHALNQLVGIAKSLRSMDQIFFAREYVDDSYLAERPVRGFGQPSRIVNSDFVELPATAVNGRALRLLGFEPARTQYVFSALS